MAKTVEIIITAKNGTSKTIRQVAADLDEVDDASKSATQGLNKTANAVDSVGDAARVSTGKLDGLIEGFQQLGGAAAIVETVKGVLDFTKEGASVIGVSQSFDGLTQSIGTTSTALLTELRAASNGYIKDTQLMQTANKAVLLGGQDLATALPTLLKIAGASARATGEDFQFIFDSLVTGISRGSVEILDNAGLTINLAATYDAYAGKLGKTADQLTDVEKKQALLNEVLDKGQGFVDKMGDSNDAVGGSLQRLETKWDNFWTGVKQDAAVGLENILSGGDFERQQSEKLLATAATYEKYVQGVNSANDAAAQGNRELVTTFGPLGVAVVGLGTIFGFTGQQTEALTQDQWTLSAAVQATGSSVTDANNSVTTLTKTTDDVTRSIRQMETGTGAMIIKAVEIEQQIRALAAAHPEYIGRINDTINVQVEQGATAEQLSGTLQRLSADLEYNEIEQTRLESATLLTAQTTVVATDTTNEFTYAIEESNAKIQENVTATIEASINQENLAYMTQLARDAASDHLGILASEEGSLYAVADAAKAAGDMLAYKALMASANQSPRNTTAARNELRAEGIDPRDQRAYKDAVVGGAQDILDPAAANARQREAERQAREFNQRNAGLIRDSRKQTRRGGGGGGKSPEVKEREKTEKELDKAEKKITEAREKYLEKREQLERDHAARVADINRKAVEERLKAERTLQTNQFDSRADFYTYVASLDQSQRQEAIARYEELWATQAELVKQNKTKEAEAYRQAAQEELQADLERAAAMRDIQAQLADETANLTQAQRDDLAEQLLLLQQSDRIYDDQAKSRLDGIKNSADSIEQARQEELAKEQGDYAEAGAKIKDEFDSVVRDVVDDAGQLADAVRQMADRLAVEAGRIISAANAVGGYAGSGNVEAGSDMAAMNVPSFDVGTGDAGLPHNMLLYGHEREIIATPRQSDQVRNLGGLDSLIRTGQQQRQQPSASDAMIRDSGPSTSRAGTGGGGVNMPIQVVVNGGGGAAPIIDVGLLKRDIEAAVNKRLEEDRKRKIMRG